MEVKAILHDVTFGADGKERLTFLCEERRDVSGLREKDLRLTVKVWREKRSLDANGLLWHCLDQIATALRADKWEIYKTMIRRYGVFTYILVREQHADQLREQFRGSEEVGRVTVNGEEAVQLLLYIGSSHYDTAQFSRLLDGVISEMEEMGLPTPEQEETERLLREWKHD